MNYDNIVTKFGSKLKDGISLGDWERTTSLQLEHVVYYKKGSYLTHGVVVEVVPNIRGISEVESAKRETHFTEELVSPVSIPMPHCNPQCFSAQVRPIKPAILQSKHH